MNERLKELIKQAGLDDEMFPLDDGWVNPELTKFAELVSNDEREACAKVAHAVITGALFDFMGWLTSRKERLLLSSSDDASPAVVVITEFAKMRGLSLEDAKVTDWNATLPPPAQQEPVAWVEVKDTYNGPYEFHGKELLPVGKHDLYTSPPAQRTWVGLTDDEIDDIFKLNHRRLGGWDYNGDDVMYDEHFESAVAAIEAKLKEKNT